jgi:hypothetical protein
MIYIINDIELLQRLCKHKILEYLLKYCVLSVSNIRLNDYSFGVQQYIKSIPGLKIFVVDDNFDEWFIDKRQNLSVSDLSSIYVARVNNDTSLVLSNEDQLLINEAKKNKVMYLQFDAFIIKMIKDEKIIQLYNLIKAA